MSTFFCKIKRRTSAWSHFAKVRDERAFTSIWNKFPYSWKVQVGFMNSSEKKYHFIIQPKVGVGPESDNRNCLESESDGGTSDSTALLLTGLRRSISSEFCHCCCFFIRSGVFLFFLGFWGFYWQSVFFYCGQNSDMFVVLLSIQVRPGYSSLTDVILMCNS